MTDLTTGGNALERTDAAISSLVDTWLVLRDLELNGERNRGLQCLKSRGMAHSNQIREFVLTDDGVRLADVYVGPSGMLTGSARLAQDAREKAERASRNEEIERQRLALESRRQAVESQIAAPRADFSAEEATIQRMINQEKQREESLDGDQATMARSRKSRTVPIGSGRVRARDTKDAKGEGAGEA